MRFVTVGPDAEVHDYTSLRTAMIAEAFDRTTAEEGITFRCYPMYDFESSLITIHQNDWGNTNDYPIIIEGVEPLDGTWAQGNGSSPGCYRIERNFSSPSIFAVATRGVVFRNIQTTGQRAGTGGQVYMWDVSSSYNFPVSFEIDKVIAYLRPRSHCGIVRHSGTTGFPPVVLIKNMGAIIANANGAWTGGTIFETFRWGVSGSNPGVVVYQNITIVCTVSDTGRGALRLSDNNGSVQNVVIQNSAGNDFQVDGSGTRVVGNNISSDATAPGSGSLTNTTLDYEDAAAFDFRLAITDTDAIDAGANLSATTYPVTEDVAGTPRPQGTAFDIGFFELPASSEIEGEGAGAFPAVTGEGAAVGTIAAAGVGTLTPLIGQGLSLSGTLATGAGQLPTLTAAGVAAGIAEGLGVGILPALAAAGEGTVPVGLPGSGTELDPYLVGSPDDLHKVRNDLNAHFRQTADIDMDVAPYNTGNGFVPIGAVDSDRLPFGGVYDGGGHVIRNLFIDRVGAGEEFVAGLFLLTVNAEIRDLGLEDLELRGGRWVGGIVGAGEFGATTLIERCYVTGTIFSTRHEVGGIIGHLGIGKVHDCWTDVRITADGSTSDSGQYGGIVGTIDGSTAERCYALGTSELIGDATGGGFPPEAVIGRDRFDNSFTPDNYWDTDTSENTTDAGFPPATGLPTADMQTDTPFPNWDTTGDIWVFRAGQYPRLHWQPEALTAPENLEVVGIGPATIRTEWANSRPDLPTRIYRRVKP